MARKQMVAAQRAELMAARAARAEAREALDRIMGPAPLPPFPRVVPVLREPRGRARHAAGKNGRCEVSSCWHCAVALAWHWAPPDPYYQEA